MGSELDNWKTQVRKGYLELCILAVIEGHKQVYGFELLDHMAALGLPIKEGTMYPLLNRMTVDGMLAAKWHTEDNRGHPRKFYSLTRTGRDLLTEMRAEFERMSEIYSRIGLEK